MNFQPIPIYLSKRNPLALGPKVDLANVACYARQAARQ